MEKTAAVITRVHWIEGPYLNEFIDWYLSLGFRKIYFINTEPHNKNKLIQFVNSKLLENVQIIDHSGGVNQFTYADELFRNIITEDYILHVDTDEFLMLGNGCNSIQDLLLLNYDLYIFHWVLVPINELYVTSMLNYLSNPNARYKSAVARKMMVNRQTYLATPNRKMSMHYFICGGTHIDFLQHIKTGIADGNEPVILHFSVRGHLHTLLKIQHQRLGKSKAKNINEFLYNDVPVKSFPMRIRIAIADIYSSQKNIPRAWNISRELTFKECTLDDLKLLYGTLDDKHNLIEKMNKGIQLHKKLNIPLSMDSGIKYSQKCIKYL